jgi:hypothetical protein
MPDNLWLQGVELRRETENTIRKGDASAVVTGWAEKSVADPTKALTEFLYKMQKTLPEDVHTVKMEQPKEKDGKLAFVFTVRLMPAPVEPKGGKEGEGTEEGSLRRR